MHWDLFLDGLLWRYQKSGGFFQAHWPPSRTALQSSGFHLYVYLFLVNEKCRAIAYHLNLYKTVEQVKGSAEIQERIITSYREARSDPDLAEQILMSTTSLIIGTEADGVGGTTSTSTIYENYLDGLHVESGI